MIGCTPIKENHNRLKEGRRVREQSKGKQTNIMQEIVKQSNGMCLHIPVESNIN